MDYRKLTRVADSLYGKVVDAPNAVPTKGNGLDQLEVRTKISDNTVDGKTMMSLTRGERRKYLASLTDSERRKALTRLREQVKIEDGKAKELLNYISLDHILNNCIYLPTTHNADLLNQWKSQYQVPAEIEVFVDAVLNNDRDAMAANLDSYIKFCADHGYKTQVRVARESINTNPMERASVEENITTDDENVNESNTDAFAEFESHFADVTDSVKENLTDAVNEIMCGEPLNALNAIEDLCFEYVAKGYSYTSVRDAVAESYAHTYKSLVDSVTAMTNLVEYNNASKIADAEDEKEEVKDEVSEDTMTETTTEEDAPATAVDDLDELGEAELKDKFGASVSEDDKTQMDLFIDALRAYADGDSEKLDTLLTTNADGDTIEEPTTNLEAKLMEENKELKEEIESKEGETSEDTEESTEKMFDCSRFIKTVGQAIRDAQDYKSLMVDAPVTYTDLVNGALSGVNLEKDVCAPYCTEYEPDVCINTPFTVGEYNQLCTCDLDPITAQIARCPEPCMCPPVQSWSPCAGCIVVNADTRPQYYYPYTMGLQAICDLMTTDGCNVTDVIRKNCVPFAQFMSVASAMNQLNAFDNRFYKKNVGTNMWSFDEVPACLTGVTDHAGSIKFVPRQTEKSFELFGSYFELV